MSCLTCPTALPTAPDMLVCWTCRDRLRDRLDPDRTSDLDRDIVASIPRLYDLLSPEKKAAEGETGRAAPSGVHSPIPIDAHTVSLTDRRTVAAGIAWQDRSGHWVWEDGPESGLRSPVDTLAGWAREVARLRDVAYPDDPTRPRVPRDDDYIGPMTRLEHAHTVRAPRPRLADLADFLLLHLDWTCGQEWVGDFASEVAIVHNQLRGATRSATGERRPVMVGRCAEPDPENPDARCDTPIFAPPPGEDLVVCRGCRSWWGPDEYLDLGDRLRAAS